MSSFTSFTISKEQYIRRFYQWVAIEYPNSTPKSELTIKNIIKRFKSIPFFDEHIKNENYYPTTITTNWFNYFVNRWSKTTTTHKVATVPYTIQVNQHPKPIQIDYYEEVQITSTDNTSASNDLDKKKEDISGQKNINLQLDYYNDQELEQFDKQNQVSCEFLIKEIQQKNEQVVCYENTIKQIETDFSYHLEEKEKQVQTFEQEKKSLQEQVKRLQQDNTSYKNEREKIIEDSTCQLEKQEKQIQSITDICQAQKQEMGNERSKYTNELYQKNETIKQQHHKMNELKATIYSLETALNGSKEEQQVLTKGLTNEQNKSTQLALDCSHLRKEKQNVVSLLNTAIKQRGESKRKETSELQVYVKISKNAASNSTIVKEVFQQLPVRCCLVESPEQVPRDADLFLFFTYFMTRISPAVQNEMLTFQGRGKRQDLVLLVSVQKQKRWDEIGCRKNLGTNASSMIFPQILFVNATLRESDEALVAFEKLRGLIKDVFPQVCGLDADVCGDNVIDLLDELGISGN